MGGYGALIEFWREIVRHSRFRQRIYHEVYHMTHTDNGFRTYDRYFSALESLVMGSNKHYYPTPLPNTSSR
jgi:hypothetical protein